MAGDAGRGLRIRFRAALADFLRREGSAVADYLDELEQRRPFKAGPRGS